MEASSVIYLDNAATSFPKPDVVYETMDRFIRTLGANPGRGGHRLAVEAEAEIDRARLNVARLFNISDHHRIIFTLNGTDALNIAIKGLLGPGDHVITSVLEHNSVSRPLQRLADDGVISLTRLACSAAGYLDPDDVRRTLTPRTRLVALTHASNVLGTVQPIREIGAIVREAGAAFLVDAAQTAGAVPIDVVADHIDLLAFPGHKSLLGPPGTGGLYVRPPIRLRPWREGGTGGDSSSPVQPEAFPFYLEGGTPNTAGIVGLGAGAAWIARTGVERIHEQEQALRSMLVEAVAEDERFVLFGPRAGQPTVAPVSIGLLDVEPQEVGAILDQSFRIAVRCGLHCAPYTHRQLGTFPQGTVRLSPGLFNTEDDLRAAIAALREIAAHSGMA
jgi:cysteine desulfurase/selenocysteine lyase